MHVFYHPLLDIHQAELTEEESRHAVRVLRMKNGDRLLVTDGKGKMYKAEIADADAKHCSLSILEETVVSPPPAVHIHLAVGATKNMDRMEWLIEKATEIGLASFIPLECDHSERTVIKKERLEKVAIAAMKQSQRNILPDILPLTSFETCLKSFAHSEIRKCIAHCAPGEKTLLTQSIRKGEHAVVFIGPEGDFSEHEIKAALEAGFKAVSLGESRLRTETAALFALSCIHVLNM
ncbi:MAG: 16S rRNA (uracil(1498)-N(3))-methyltransferase [Bacteroidia bacterium]